MVESVGSLSVQATKTNAALLLDGPLRLKQPEAAAEADHHGRDVMRAFRVMIRAGLWRGDEA